MTCAVGFVLYSSFIVVFLCSFAQTQFDSLRGSWWIQFKAAGNGCGELRNNSTQTCGLVSWNASIKAAYPLSFLGCSLSFYHLPGLREHFAWNITSPCPEIDRLQKGETKKEEESYLDLFTTKNIKLKERVLIPVKQYPKVRFLCPCLLFPLLPPLI